MAVARDLLCSLDLDRYCDGGLFEWLAQNPADAWPRQKTVSALGPYGIDRRFYIIPRAWTDQHALGRQKTDQWLSSSSLVQYIC